MISGWFHSGGHRPCCRAGLEGFAPVCLQHREWRVAASHQCGDERHQILEQDLLPERIFSLAPRDMERQGSISHARHNLEGKRYFQVLQSNLFFILPKSLFGPFIWRYQGMQRKKLLLWNYPTKGKLLAGKRRPSVGSFCRKKSGPFSAKCWNWRVRLWLIG